MSLQEAFRNPSVHRMSHYNADEILRRLHLTGDNKIEGDIVRFIFREMCGHQNDSKYRIDKYRSVVDSAVENLKIRLDLLNAHEQTFFEGCQYNRDALVLALLADDYLPAANASISDENGRMIGRRSDFDSETLGDAAIFLEDSRRLEESYTFSWQFQKEVSFLAHLSVLMDTQLIVEHFDEYEVEDLQSYKDHAFMALASYIGDESPIGKNIVDHVVRIEEEIDRRRPSASIIPFRSPRP